MRFILKCAVLGFVMLMIGCSDVPVLKSDLSGYRDGKKQMKYQTQIFVHKYEDGTKGYRQETLFKYGIGNKKGTERIYTSYMNQDYSLRESKTDLTNEYGSMVTRVKVEKDKAIIFKQVGEGEEQKQEVPITGPVFEMQPLLYVNGIKSVGGENFYQVLLADSGEVKTVKVKYVDNPNVFINKERYATSHYQIEQATSPGQFDDYWLDIKTNEIMKIQVGDIQFRKD